MRYLKSLLVGFAVLFAACTPEEVPGEDTTPKEPAAPVVVSAQLKGVNGEAEIIGNKPLTPKEEDYPIHYGKSKDSREKVLYLQCGRLCRKLPLGKPLFEWDLSHCGIGFNIEVRISVLKDCIRANSNLPFWEQPLLYWVKDDLRNPKLKAEREAVFKQFGLNAADYVKADGTDSPNEQPTKKSFFDIFKKK